MMLYSEMERSGMLKRSQVIVLINCIWRQKISIFSMSTSVLEGLLIPLLSLGDSEEIVDSVMQGSSTFHLLHREVNWT